MVNKVLLPMIRKMMPSIIARDIVGVQPMSIPATSNIFTMRGGLVAFKDYILASKQDECALYGTPEQKYYAVDVRPNVEEWLLTQPLHMWKYAKDTEDCHMACVRYIVCEELLTWMTVKWA